MKALILSAGLGTRLRPITNALPKVMVPINGRPCLEYAILNLRRYGVRDFAINTHHMPTKIFEFFGAGEKGVGGYRIEYSIEPEPLGTSGALNGFRKYFASEPFFVVYGDVLANFDAAEALEVHKRTKGLMTIVLDSLRLTKGKGAVLVEGDKVTKFIEKPTEEIPGALVNSGFYVVEPEVLSSIPLGFSDFGRDIIPALVKTGRVNAVKHKGYLYDIGTPEDLKLAEEFLAGLGK